MKLAMLGTGHALVTRCYNACFALCEDEVPCNRAGVASSAPSNPAASAAPVFLVDAGGGNGILSQLERAGIDWRRIHDLFITHTHIDHLMGAVWILRVVCYGMECGAYAGELTVWGNDEVISAVGSLARMLLRPSESRFIGERVFLRAVRDGEHVPIMGHDTAFFDVRSKGSAKQFGFVMEYEPGKRFSCSGDEPLVEANFPKVEGAAWLVHEAYCLASEEERFNPHPIHHGTVAEACDTARRLGVSNLVLYHTEDEDLSNRKRRYLEEGARHFAGALHVPDDLETLTL